MSNKVCPICQSTYEDAVDFCFKDGAPLDFMDEGAGRAMDIESTFDGLGIDELEPPDAISLSNLPAVGAEDFERSHADLGPDHEPMDGAPPSRPKESGVADPFGGDLYDVPDAEASKADLATLSGVDLPSREEQEGTPDPTGLPEPGATASAEPSASEAPPSVPAEEEDAKPEPAMEAAGASAPAKPVAAKPEPARRAPSAPQRAGRAPEQDSGGGRKVGMVIGLACLVLLGLIGWMLMGGDKDASETTSASTAAAPAELPPPAPTGASPEVPAPTPAEETPSEEEDAASETDGLAEGAPVEDGAASDGASDSLVESSETGDSSPPSRETSRPAPPARERATPAAERPTPKPSVAEPPFQVTPTPRPERTPRPQPTPRRQATPTPQPTPAPSLGGGSAANLWGAPAATKGTIAVSSTPSGAKVSVDGRSYGASPVRVELSLGDHTIQLEAVGYKSATRTVKLQTTKVVTVDVVMEKVAPAASAAIGTLNVVTTPTSAMLYLDGAAKGRTPISVSVAAGVHEFKFQVEGKAPQSIRHDVKIRAGETKTKVFQLQ